MENSHPLPSSQASSLSPEAPSEELAHWCHQCNAEISAELSSAGADGDLVCPDCGGGFIEAMDTARALASVQRALRRHSRRRQQQPSSGGVAGRRYNGRDDRPDEASPRQVLRLLRYLARTTRNSPMQLSSRLPVDGQAGDRSQISAGGFHGRGPSSTSSPTRESLPDDHTETDTYETENSEVADLALNHDSIGAVQNDTAGSGGESPGLLAQDGTLSLEDDVDEDQDDDESVSEAEAGLLELSDWESLEEEEEEDDDDDDVEDDDEDDDEWEEVEYDEADLVVRFLEAVDDGLEEGAETVRDEGEQGLVDESVESQGNRPLENSRARPRTLFPRSLRRRLQAFRRNLERYDSDIHLEGSEVENYVGNPGDYVDAQGFEELLQQLIETDNTRRGAPPAAKSVVEGLPSVVIQKSNLEDGSALCAICKEVVALDEPAKQLPCLHLYHSVCILPWLGSRNSCPVCRYELPTDDPDYEEQKKRHSSHRTGSNSGSSNTFNSSLVIEAQGSDGNLSGDQSSTNTSESASQTLEQENESSNCLKDNMLSLEDTRANTAMKNAVLQSITGSLLNAAILAAFCFLSGNIVFGSSMQNFARHVSFKHHGKLKEAEAQRPWWMCLFR